MAIQPIDLQAIFAQLDNLARTQLAQREGVALQQAMQGVQIQRKADEQAKTVSEAQDLGDGVEKARDEGRKKRDEEEEKGKNAKANDSDATRPGVFKDLGLGKNVDINF
ncbi:MAG: hypothetical protein FWE09_06720 [Treponema sp.]|nr:hypothetical protein [Treponema sp.]